MPPKVMITWSDEPGTEEKHGRIMAIMTHNTDISDSFEREGEDPQFFYQFSPNGYAIAMNILVHVLSH